MKRNFCWAALSAAIVSMVLAHGAGAADIDAQRLIDADKNRAWDLLCAAKQSYDLIIGSARLDAWQAAAAEAQLAVCESSDWFWWFGDYNPSQAVLEFDRLYRHQLASLYRLLGRGAPAALAQVISVGRGTPEGGGVMRRAQQ